MSGEGIGMSFDVGTGEGAKPKAPEASFQEGQTPGGALPFRVIVCADFRGEGAERAPAPRRARISTFDEDFAALAPSLYLHVPDVIGAGEKSLEVTFSPQSLSELRPDAILAKAEALAPLALLREQLAGLQDGSFSADRFEAGLSGHRQHAGLSGVLDLIERSLGKAGSAPAPAPSSSAPAGGTGDSVLDNLLDMVAMPGQEDAPTPSESKAKAAIDGFVKGSGSGKADFSQAQAALDALCAKQLQPILADPQLRRVEAAWRGAKLALEAAGRSKGIRVELVDTDLGDALSTIKEHVFGPASKISSDPPPSMVLLDKAYGRSAADFAELAELAEGADLIQAPLIVSLDDAFLGISAPSELAGRDQLADLLGPGLEKWRSLRDQEPSRWLAATYNRILLRLPYEAGKKGSRAAGESVDSAADLLWGNAGWGLLATIVASSARCNWPSEFRGLKQGLAGLPQRPEAAPDQRGPVAVRLAERHTDDFASEGVIALTYTARSDQVVVTRGPVVRKAPSGEPPVFTALPYQLVATRIAETLLRAKGRISGSNPEEVAGRWQDYALAVIGDTGQGGGVGARIEDGVLSLRIVTGHEILNGAEFRLGFSVGGPTG
jgi:type VI secretion system protein ImpC